MLAAVTIAISIQTSTATVFAADSKLTTSGLVGFDDVGEPQFVSQTYDNATKIVRDTAGYAMAVVAGAADLGRISVMDYIASSEMPRGDGPDQQESAIREFIGGIARLRATYWHEAKVNPDRWPVTVVLLAMAPTYTNQPAVWRVVLRGEEPDVIRLTNPVYLEGSYDGAFSLLYGYRSDVIRDLVRALTIDETKRGARHIKDSSAHRQALRRCYANTGRYRLGRVPCDRAGSDGAVSARRAGLRWSHRRHGLESRPDSGDIVAPRKGAQAPAGSYRIERGRLPCLPSTSDYGRRRNSKPLGSKTG
jgi:hypothetical protein